MKKTIVSIMAILIILSITPLSGGVEEASDNSYFDLIESNLINKEESFNEYETDTNQPTKYTFCNDSAPPPEFVPGEIIVRFRENTRINPKPSTKGIINIGIPSIDQLNVKYRVTAFEKVFKQYPVPFISNVYKLNISEEKTIASAIADYQKDKNVEYAEPNYIYHTCVIPMGDLGEISYRKPPDKPPQKIPNDPYFNMQWALDQPNDCDIDAPEAWDIEKGSSDVVIAIIDTGVDYNHPDLADNIWINEKEDINHNGRFDKYPWWLGGDIDRKDNDGNGFVDDVIGRDFVGIFSDNDPIDDYGHGTHCAGIAAAVTNNGIGVAGIGWNCKIMVVKGLTSNDGEVVWLVNSILYATYNGADVISMSWGGVISSNLMLDTLDYAYSQGVVLVSAAGNDFEHIKHYPAAYDTVIAVAATDQNDDYVYDPDWWGTNYGYWVDVGAPGVYVYSTMPTYDVFMTEEYGYNKNYDYCSGTSMACPHVAGLAGLILSKNLELDQEEIKGIICSTVDNYPNDRMNNGREYYQYFGSGRINAYNALAANCIVIITSPLGNEDVSGVTNIIGTAKGDNFEKYEVKYGSGIYPYVEGNWTTTLLYSSNEPVDDDVLAVWDTTIDDEGVYTLLLRVTDTSGNEYVYENVVIVNNVPNTLYVGSGPSDWWCVPIAFLNAGDGDTVYLRSGTHYQQFPIYWYGSAIDRPINFVGESADNTKIKPVLRIYADWVNVSRIHFQSNGIFIFSQHNTIERSIFNRMGVTLWGANNNTIQNNSFSTEHPCVDIFGGSNNVVRGNNITSQGKPEAGFLSMYEACNNIIEWNNISNSPIGIELKSRSQNNIIRYNEIFSNDKGITLWGPHISDNIIHHNNFIGNGKNVFFDGFLSRIWQNQWDDGSEGNYWDDYEGCDILPPYGIGDIPYYTSIANIDWHPLMKPYDGTPVNNQANQIAIQINPQNSQSQQNALNRDQQSSNTLTLLRMLEQIPNTFPKLN